MGLKVRVLLFVNGESLMDKESGEDKVLMKLVHCHTCGYEIPPVLGERCPECGTLWDEDSVARQSRREGCVEDFKRCTNVRCRIWLGVLVVNAIGAGIASEFSVQMFFYTLLGIGFGITGSIMVGYAICRFGPVYERALRMDVWMRCLGWVHGPWLMISGFTLVGVLVSLILRLFHNSIDDTLLMVFVLIEFGIWVILCFVVVLRWDKRYREGCADMGVVFSSTASLLHTLFALIIWLGSGLVGLMGGALGAVLMAQVADNW